MGSTESEENIPCLVFSRDQFEEGSEEWKKMSKKVREACENHGCFLFKFDEIPKALTKDMFMCLQTLFDLPEETKRKHISPTLFSSYTSENPRKQPFSQTFGVDEPHLEDSVQAFTNLMWPQGNQAFCETMKSISSKMLELSILIQKMILDGYGLPKQYTSDFKDMSTSNLRLIKYKVPKSNDKGGEHALGPHTDKSNLTIICQNDVDGLQALTKTNKWIPMNIPKDGFAVFVGDILKAWTNGRLHAPTHRVTMRGDKERYSFGLFSLPKDDIKIEVPPELVDDKIHPLRYRSFNYVDYIQYFLSMDRKENTHALDLFAGV